MAPTFQTVRLAPGRHAEPSGGVCVMELTSMLAGQPLSDRPGTVSPGLAAFLRGYNDGVDDRRRQTLKRYAAEALGTARGRAAERSRRHMVRDVLAAEDPTAGPLVRRLAVLDLQHVGRALGMRVRTDPALHERILALLDRLVAADHPHRVMRVPADAGTLAPCTPPPARERLLPTERATSRR